MNDLIAMLAQGAPAKILGIVVGKDKHACMVKFGDGNRDECANFVRDCFCKFAKKGPHDLLVTRDDGEGRVEIHVKG